MQFFGSFPGMTATLGLSLIACSASHRSGQEPVIGVTSELELAENEEPDLPQDQAEEVPADVVAQAARPFAGYRAFDQRPFEPESLFTHLAAADAICIGEQHGNALDHYAELALLQALLERRALRGYELGVGLEMVRAGFQGQLLRFNEHKLPLAELPKAVFWQEEWGYPFPYYAPLFEESEVYGASLLALGTDRALSRAIAERGLAELGEKEARAVPVELDFDDDEHRRLFDALTQDHPHGDPAFLYEAQVVWDESMAERGASYLRGRSPGRKLIVVAGAAHCHRSAIPSRLARRGGFQVVSVIPVEGEPERVLPEPERSTAEHHLLAGYDYQIVFTKN